MSVDTPVVLGASTTAGGMGAGVAELAHTGNPMVVGIVTAAVMIVVLGLITRATQNS